MFVEGLTRMYVEQPDMFWMTIWGITPTFTLGFFWGVWLQSKEPYGRTISMWKGVAIITTIGVVWVYFYTNWLAFDDIPMMFLELLLTTFLLMFPLLGGAMTGMWILKAYCFVVYYWQRCFKT